MNCSNCGMYVPENNYRCPNCNKVAQTDVNPEDFKRKAARRAVFNPNVIVSVLLMAGLAALAFIMISRGGGTTDSTLQAANSDVTGTGSERNIGNTRETTASNNYDNNDNNVTGGTIGELDLGYVVNTQNPGEMMQISDFIQGDQITIFDFYSEYCPPCRRISPLLKQLDKKRKDIVVFKVDINRPSKRGIDWKSPLAQQYNLRSVPHFIIYNSDGELELEGKPAFGKIERYLRSEGIIR